MLKLNGAVPRFFGGGWRFGFERLVLFQLILLLKLLRMVELDFLELQRLGGGSIKFKRPGSYSFRENERLLSPELLLNLKLRNNVPLTFAPEG